MNQEKHKSYIASEYLASDGPFESPQNFKRLNIMGKYTVMLSPGEELSVLASHFESIWDASGQIPQRAVDSGSISRFGAIDDTEGGQTSRTNVRLSHTKSLQNKGRLENSLYLVNYDFDLFSNFTFFLDDPVNGDQIRQQESRSIYGLTSDYSQPLDLFSNKTLWQAGISLRYDQSRDNQLTKTTNRREVREVIQRGDINESNMGIYTGLQIHFGRWTLNPAIRLDHFDFQYTDALSTRYSNRSISSAIVSPKLNLSFDVNPSLQFYLKAGKGFHSNDTRVVVAQEGRQTLPASLGYDLGYMWKPIPKLLVNMAYWYLFLEQEFVYVGDAGIVEPSGKTQRQGVDLSLRYQAHKNVFFNLDGTYSHARSTEEESGQDYIPLAPITTLVAGINLVSPAGFYGSANLRYLGDRPANEDYSITARGYTVVDMNIGYQWKSFDLGIQVQNLLDTDWEEAQFATESRLFDEAAPVEEIHFTPGSPLFIKGSLAFSF